MGERRKYRLTVDDLDTKYKAITQHDAAMDKHYEVLKKEIDAKIREIGGKAREADDALAHRMNSSFLY